MKMFDEYEVEKKKNQETHRKTFLNKNTRFSHNKNNKDNNNNKGEVSKQYGKENEN